MVGEPHVLATSIFGAPAVSVSAKSGSVYSPPPDSGAPVPFVRPMMPSCSDRRTRSHVSTSIAILRATRYEPPAIQSGESDAATQTCVVEGRGVVGEDVGGAVLVPEQVARGLLVERRLRRAAVPELRPAQLRAAEGDAAQVADGVHRDLRIVGAGLDAQVATARLRVEVVAEEGREPFEPLRPARGDAVAVFARLGREQGGTESDRDGQSGGRQALRFTRVVRWRFGRSADRTGRADLQPLGHARGGVRPVLQERDQVVAVRARHHVEGREVQMLLDGRRDARLMGTEEVVRGCRGLPFRRPPGADAGGESSGSPGDEPCGTGPHSEAEQPPATHPGVGLRRDGCRRGVDPRRQLIGLAAVGHARRAPWP